MRSPNIKDAPERVPTIMHIALQIAAALAQFRLLFYRIVLKNYAAYSIFMSRLGG